MTENTRLRAMRSFYSMQHKGLVTLDDDVLSIVSQVRDLYGDRITVELDPDTGWYHFIEHCEDYTDRLIFSAEHLDPRALDRLLQGDSQARGYRDPYGVAETEQDALQRAHDDAQRERLIDAGEQLAHALKKDGAEPRLPLMVPISRGIKDA